MESTENSDKIKVYYWGSLNSAPSFALVSKELKKNKAIGEQASISIEELCHQAEIGSKYLLLAAVREKSEMNDLINLLSTVGPQVRKRNVVPIVLTKLNNRKIEDLLIRSGCAEVLGLEILSKTLLYKINRYLKNLEKHDVGLEMDSDFVRPNRSGSTAKPAAAKSPTSAISFVDPFEAIQDVWILTRSNHVKKLGGSWFVELLGPSPAAGDWVKYGSDQRWLWQPGTTFPHFDFKEFKWVFEGREPVYSWDLNRWAFFSEAPKFSLFNGDTLVFDRFHLTAQPQFVMTRNSKSAVEQLPKIIETFNKQYRFAHEKQKQGEASSLTPDGKGIPWGDQVAPDDLKGLQWNQGDLAPDAESAGPQNKLDLSSDKAKLLTGVESMKPCGLKGTLKDTAVEIQGYADDRYFIIGAPAGLVQKDETLLLRIQAKNLGKKDEYAFDIQVIESFQLGTDRVILKALPLGEGVNFFKTIETLVVGKQNELTSFLDKAKGLQASAAAEITSEDEAIVKAYLAEANILILDPISSSRVSLASSLVRMGALRNKMSLVGSIDEANQAAKATKIKMIFSEYMIGSRSGFDFIQEHNAVSESEKIFDRVSVLVTSSASQSAAARSAEEDIDQFVVKPYHFDSIRKMVSTAIISKLKPSPYVVAIAESKKLILGGFAEEAEAKLTEAMSLDPAPALALYYLGQVEWKRGHLIAAESHFKSGLEINPIHFKCLNGLHELLWTEKRAQEAYEVVKVLINYFPANSQRLSHVLRSAIVTDSFQDMEKYYQIYLNIEDRTDELIKYICSAMVVTGKYYLRNQARPRALELFENAAVSAAGKTHFLRAIIESLLDYKMVNEAERFLKRLQSVGPVSIDFQACKFLVGSNLVTLPEAVHLGRQTVANDIEVPSVYLRLIQLSVAGGYLDEASALAAKAQKLWPDKKDLFRIPESA